MHPQLLAASRHMAARTKPLLSNLPGRILAKSAPINLVPLRRGHLNQKGQGNLKVPGLVLTPTEGYANEKLDNDWTSFCISNRTEQ